MRWLGNLLFGGILLGLASGAEATPVTVFGQPVTGIGSSIQAVPNCSGPSAPGCFNPSTGSINFFIPINPADGGTFGVTHTPSGPSAGTFSDSRTGPFSNSGILTMNLLYTPIASPLPVTSASLAFTFVDLDLVGGSDPRGFYESVKLFNATGGQLSPLITQLGQSSAGSPLPFTVSGTLTSQTILFPNVASLVGADPLNVQLRFGSRIELAGTWRNTMESLTSTLTLTSSPVPGPDTLILFGSGLVGLAAWRRMTKL